MVILSTTCRCQVVSAGAKTPAKSSRYQHCRKLYQVVLYQYSFNLYLSIHVESSFRIDFRFLHTGSSLGRHVLNALGFLRQIIQIHMVRQLSGTIKLFQFAISMLYSEFNIDIFRGKESKKRGARFDFIC